MKTVSSNDVNNLPVYDFSNDKSEVDEIKEAIEQAEAAMAAPAADRFKDALVAESIAAKPLIKAKKAAKKGKAGRIVGISKDENEFLQTLLLDIIADHSYDELIEKNQAAYDKLVARYNK